MTKSQIRDIVFADDGRGGRGVFITSAVEEGEIIGVCDIIVLSPEDTVTIQETKLKHYTYLYNDLQDCLAIGFGSLINHSQFRANTKYELVDNGSGYRVLRFTALRKIERRSEILIDYNSDHMIENIEDTLNHKPLVPRANLLEVKP